MIDAAAAQHPAPARPQARLALALCPLCGEDDAEPVAVGRDFAHDTTPESFLAVCCRACELVYLNPQPSAEERPSLYPPGYFSPPASGRRLAGTTLAVTRRALRCCRSLPADARVLEVGYGPTLHLDALRRSAPSAWTLEALTPHAPLVAAARRAGFRVYEADGPEALTDRPASYDAVLLLQSLEHCPAPLELALSLRSLLRSGGRLVIVTHNADSSACRRFRGRHWAGYDFPRHACLFHPRSVRRLADEAGFGVERLGTASDWPMWGRSAANLLEDWAAPSWVTGGVRRGSSLVAGLALAAEAVARGDGRGGWLEAVLRKPAELDG